MWPRNKSKPQIRAGHAATGESTELIPAVPERTTAARHAAPRTRRNIKPVSGGEISGVLPVPQTRSFWRPARVRRDHPLGDLHHLYDASSGINDFIERVYDQYDWLQAHSDGAG